MLLDKETSQPDVDARLDVAPRVRDFEFESHAGFVAYREVYENSSRGEWIETKVGEKYPEDFADLRQRLYKEAHLYQYRDET